MKKITCTLFMLLMMLNLCWAGERNYSNSYFSTSISSSAASVAQSKAIEIQKSMNTYTNHVLQTPAPQMYQQPKFLNQNSSLFNYSQKNLTTQNLNTQLNYSQQLNKLKQGSIRHENQGINLATPPVLNSEQFKDDPSKTILPLNSQNQ